ncbi:MAG: hypothetical protein GX242_05850 [Clostridiales bacterium]|nr:hypothetical protein [Clostridiales bacterium]
MTGLISYDLFVKSTSGGNVWFTPEGGIYQYFFNDTQEKSVKGTIVCISSMADNAVSVAPAFSQDAIGVIYEDGVEPNCLVKVVIAGNAQVLLRDGYASTKGAWCGVSEMAGRMYQTTSPQNFEERFRQIGYSLEQKCADDNQLSLVHLVFN